MCRSFVFCLVLFLTIAGPCRASSKQEKSATCNFDDGKQITVRYKSVSVSDRKLPEKLWSPGGSPMFLFTSATLKLGNKEVPVGAYSMYVIPGKDHWTLVLNKNVAPNTRYEHKQDLLRVPMDTGTLTQPAKTVGIYFGHVAPKQCNMRIYYGTTGAWAEFYEK